MGLDLSVLERLGPCNATGRTLVVVLHGWTIDPEQMRDVRNAVCDSCLIDGGLDIFPPRLPHARLLSFAPLSDIVQSLHDAMNQLCKDPGRYATILFVGFSMGAVLARQLFLSGAGEGPTSRTESEQHYCIPCGWATKVSRIIMLGGMNRGWSPSGRMRWQESFANNLIGLAGHGWPGGSSPVVFQIRRGAPFIVQARLRWLQRANSGRYLPFVVQLLGTRDNLIGPDDAVDFATDGDRYCYLDMPGTGHEDAIVFSGPGGDKRREIFQQALTSNEAALHGVPRRYLADTLPPPPNTDVKRVIFVVHGIRDDGYWTRKIAQRVHEAASEQGIDVSTVRCVTATYGYFAMLPFVLPWVRREKVEWLSDLYVGVRAQYPDAVMSFVGHSNGTYLAARALRDYADIQFENVLFAGSVVRGDYPWLNVIEQGRVGRVANITTVSDLVVALFPNGMRPVRQIDLGGAGVNGFKCADYSPCIRNIAVGQAGHAGGLSEVYWPSIARYLLGGEMPSRIEPLEQPLWRRLTPDWAFRGLAFIAPCILLAILVTYVWLHGWLLSPIVLGETATADAVARVMGSITILGVTRFFVTRV